MRHIFLAVILLASCGPPGSHGSVAPPIAAFGATPSGFATQPTGVYALSVASGDGQSGPAFKGLLGTGAFEPFPLPLVVEVRDSSGALADGVEVLFAAQPQALGLGTAVSGWPPVTAGVHGQASTLCQPYEVGIIVVTCSLVPPAVGNQVSFVELGR